ATYVAQHPEMLKVLADGGCSSMFMGLESISQESLKSVQKQNTAKMYEDLIRRVHDHGIDIHAGFVRGLDHEDVSSFERTAEWVNRMGLCGAIFRILTPYPGTRLFEQLKAEGRLLTTNWTYYSGEHVVYRPAKMSVEELYWGQKWLKRQFYAYRSIGERALRRAGRWQKGGGRSEGGAGAGFRVHVHLAGGGGRGGGVSGPPAFAAPTRADRPPVQQPCLWRQRWSLVVPGAPTRWRVEPARTLSCTGSSSRCVSNPRTV